jgi:pyruvate/2-oxoglutarate/acetoin dehydrogenase E1 component
MEAEPDRDHAVRRAGDDVTIVATGAMVGRALAATVPYSKPMEDYLLPDEEKIIAAVRAVLS